MFNIFKKKAPVPEAPKCTCGAWPDPTWTHADFLKKHEAVKVCPVHKGLQMMMVVSQIQRPQMPVSTPVMEEPILTLEEELKEELRAARIHLLNGTECILATDPLWQELNKTIERLEGIIQERR